LSTTQNFCGECGSGLPDGAAFCGECGAAVFIASDNRKTKIKQKGQRKKENLASNPATSKNGFKIVPLFIWAGTWSVGWIFAPAIYALVMSDFYFLGSWLEGLLFWLAVGLIAAALLQWFEITSRRPTTKTALIVICSWIVFICVMQWMHQTYNEIPMAIAGSFIGGCLALIMTKQVARTGSGSLAKMSINKLMGGWALCGACGGLPYWYFPLKYFFIIVLFITVLAMIVKNREK
jgi:hypothetical protein